MVEFDKKFRKPRCPDCGSYQVLYRSKTDDYRCRICGELSKKDDVMK